MKAVNPTATIPGSIAQSSIRLVAPKPWRAVPAGLRGRRRLAGRPVIGPPAAAIRRSMIASAKAAVPAVPPRS